MAPPEEARAVLEARLAWLDQGLTAVEHGEAPGRAGWAVRGVRAEDETAEWAAEGAGTAGTAGG